MRKLTREEFINRANIIHNFKFLYDNSIYVNVDTKLEIICPIHGPFQQRPDHHLKGHTCKRCSVIPSIESRRVLKNEYIEHCSKIHNNFYDYSRCEYFLGKDMVDIICPNHGVFTQRADHHKRGSGCPHCKIVSKGEIAISKYLIEHDIPFKFQKTYNSLRGTLNQLYKFDFYIPHLNLLIEYDGIQHFKPIEYFGGEKHLEYVLKNDNIKNQFCIDSNIPLLRISYKENITKKLREHLFVLPTNITNNPPQ